MTAFELRTRRARANGVFRIFFPLFERGRLLFGAVSGKLVSIEWGETASATLSAAAGRGSSGILPFRQTVSVEGVDVKKSYLAIDMGASSGRCVVGRFDGKKIELEELYRYENGPVDMNGSLYWDLPGLWKSVQNGLRAVGAKYGAEISSVGVDTWGVDFAFLGRGGELLGNPYCYRDPRTDGAMERAFNIVSRDEIFAQTGLQFMQFNSLYQLSLIHI